MWVRRTTKPSLEISGGGLRCGTRSLAAKITIKQKCFSLLDGQVGFEIDQVFLHDPLFVHASDRNRDVPKASRSRSTLVIESPERLSDAVF